MTQFTTENGVAYTEPVTVVVTQINSNPASTTYSAYVDSTAGSASKSSQQPLTTFFTPPAICTSGPWVSINGTQGEITCTRAIGASAGTSCFPPGSSEYLYSPGVCPTGYIPAAEISGASAVTSICCLRYISDTIKSLLMANLDRSGMAYQQTISSCVQILPLDAAAGTLVVVSNYTTPSYTEPFLAYAPTIAVAWASSDLEYFTPVSAPNQGVIVITSTLSGSTPSAPAGSSVSRHHASMNVGSKTGIGIGASLGALILIALGAWALLRRRNARTAKQRVSSGDKAELPGQDAEKKSFKVTELGPDGEVYEKGGHGRPVELEHDIRYELEGAFRGHEAGGPLSPSGDVEKFADEL